MNPNNFFGFPFPFQPPFGQQASPYPYGYPQPPQPGPSIPMPIIVALTFLDSLTDKTAQNAAVGDGTVAVLDPQELSVEEVRTQRKALAMLDRWFDLQLAPEAANKAEAFIQCPRCNQGRMSQHLHENGWRWHCQHCHLQIGVNQEEVG